MINNMLSKENLSKIHELKRALFVYRDQKEFVIQLGPVLLSESIMLKIYVFGSLTFL